MTWWMVSLSSSSGAAVKAQLGKNYYMLPGPYFECPWHRRKVSSDEMRRRFEETGLPVTFPCEVPAPWWPERVREDALNGLPSYQLPDWRQVTFVPNRETFGTVLPHEWKRIVAAAKVWRGPLIEHAYDVSLEILRRWKKIGSATLQHLHEGERRIRNQESQKHPSVGLPHEDIGIPNWIFLCARDLYYLDGDEDEKRRFDDRMKAFKPHQLAFAAVAAATGYTVSSVESILRRSRAAGPKRRQTVTERRGLP
jgi:hypothetical protein